VVGSLALVATASSSASAKGGLSLFADGAEAPLKEGAEVELTLAGLVGTSSAGTVECTNVSESGAKGSLAGTVTSNGGKKATVGLTSLSFSDKEGKGTSSEGTCAGGNVFVSASGLPWTGTLTSEGALTLKGSKKLAVKIRVPAEGVTCQYERASLAATFPLEQPLVAVFTNQVFKLAKKGNSPSCATAATFSGKMLGGVLHGGGTLKEPVIASNLRLRPAFSVPVFANYMTPTEGVAYDNNFYASLDDAPQRFFAQMLTHGEGGFPVVQPFEVDCNVLAITPLPIGFPTTITQQATYHCSSGFGSVPDFNVEEVFGADGSLTFPHNIVVPVMSNCTLELITHPNPATVALETAEFGVNANASFSGDEYLWGGDCTAFNEETPPNPLIARAELDAHFSGVAGTTLPSMFEWLSP